MNNLNKHVLVLNVENQYSYFNIFCWAMTIQNRPQAQSTDNILIYNIHYPIGYIKIEILILCIDRQNKQY